MKTFLKTICLLLCLGFATESQAQTKEETIAWIKEKLEKYPIQSKNVVMSIDACKISVEEYVMKNGREIIFQKHTAPTNPKGFSTLFLEFEGKVVETTYQGKLEYGNVLYIFDSKREADLGNRMLKALQHLNTFCEKKKETF